MSRGEWMLVQLVGRCGGRVYAYARQPSALATWVVRVETGREVHLRAVWRRTRTTRRIRLHLTDMTLADVRRVALTGVR